MVSKSIFTGSRIVHAYVGRLLFLCCLCFVLSAIAAHGDTGPGNWWMFHHDRQHTGRSFFIGPASPEQQWAFHTGNGIQSSPVIGADGTIYIGSYGWQSAMPSTRMTHNNGRFPLTRGIYCLPGHRGGRHHLHRIVRMTISMPSTRTARSSGRFPPGIISIPPRPSGRTAPSTSGRVMTISMPSTRTARNSGRFPPDGQYHFLSGHRTDGTIYVGSWDGNAICHQPGWHAKVDVSHGGAIVSSPAVGADGTIYVGSSDNNLYAVNPDGTTKWAFTNREYVSIPPRPSGRTAPSTSDRMMIISMPSTRTARNSGRFPPEAWISSSPAIGADGTIYLGSSDGNLYAINPDGSQLWVSPIGNYFPGYGISSSPALGADGTIYAGSWDFNVYAIGSAAPTSAINPIDHAAMVWVPGGSFTMGSSLNGDMVSAGQTQQVTLSGYWLYTGEVTVAQYLAFCADTGHAVPPWPGPSGDSWAGKSGWTDPSIQQDPIVNVTWYDAQAYAAWAGVSLPTEAQYEYAARGPQENNYPWGGTATALDPDNGWNINNCASWFNSGDQGISTWPVGSFPAGMSWCGAMDMSGNVWEWCADWYGDGDYSSTPVTNPIGPAMGNIRIIRGGAWDYFNGTLDTYRCATRNGQIPSGGYNDVGFRCATSTIPVITPLSNSIITIAQVTTDVAATVQVPVTLTALGDENTLGGTIAFDPAILSNPQVSLGTNDPSAALLANTSQAANGLVSFAVALPPGQTFPAGTQQVAVLTFDLLDTSFIGPTPLTFTEQPMPCEFVDVNANDLNATWQNGSVTIDHAPVAVNDNYTINENTILDINASTGVLANDSDVDGNALTAVLQTGPSYGTLTFKADGSFSYIPWLCFVGTDTFTYQAYDGMVYSNTATVTITVNATGYEGDVAPRPYGNGVVTLADWVQEGRYIVGLDPIPAYPNSIFMAADCAPLSTKGDGQLTVADWVQVGRFALGLDPRTTIGGPAQDPPGGTRKMSASRLLAGKTARALSVDAATLTRGKAGSVCVSLNALGEESALGFSMHFDPKRLKFVSAKVTGAVADATLNVNTTDAAQGNLGVALMLPLPKTCKAGKRGSGRVHLPPARRRRHPAEFQRPGSDLRDRRRHCIRLAGDLRQWRSTGAAITHVQRRGQALATPGDLVVLPGYV